MKPTLIQGVNMSKHHHRDKEEQMNNRSHDKAQSERNDKSHQKVGLTESGSHAADDSSIQLRAYQIYNEKGGTALDNWLEAEQIVKDSAPDDSGFVTESEPNTYRKINPRAAKVDIYQ